ARARPAPVRRVREPGAARRPRRDRGRRGGRAGRAAGDVRVRPVGDRRHRAQPRAGRARPAHARRVRRGGMTMDFGTSIFITDEMPGPGHIGRGIEERGFDSMFIAEHTHMPRDSVRDVDRKYYRALDPFVALTAAAATTTSLRLGFGIMLLPQRDPITTAKAVASLDYVSGGRVEIGLGAGWNVPEIENHGTPFKERFGVMRERAEAMKAIWTEDEAPYNGRYVNFHRITSWPKPVQKPHPPLW